MCNIGGWKQRATICYILLFFVAFIRLPKERHAHGRFLVVPLLLARAQRPHLWPPIQRPRFLKSGPRGLKKESHAALIGENAAFGLAAEGVAVALASK